MSDRIIESFNEMKQIYLSSISGNYIQEGNEYLNYITEEKEDKPGEKYENKYKKTGKKSKDYDGDGEVEDEADEYSGVKDRAIKKAIGDSYEDDEDDEDEDEKEDKNSKKKNKKELDEFFSDWRNELYESIGDIESEIDASKEKQIVEKPVKNKIEINPSISVAEQVLYVEELNENFIYEAVELATEFFYSNGINDNGIELIAEELGEAQFIDYVFGIADELSLSEEYLSEKTRLQKEIEKKGGAAPRQTVGSGKNKGMHYSQLKKEDPKAFNRAISSTKQHKERQASGSTEQRSSRKRKYHGPAQREKLAKNITMDRGNIATQNAKQTQSTKKPNKTAIGSALMGALGFAGKVADATRAGIERHNTATKQFGKAASQTANTAGKIATNVGRAAQEFGSGARAPFETKAGRNLQAGLIRGARALTKAAVNTAAKEYARQKVKSTNLKETLQLVEKATSEQQQKIFGLALSVKRGDTPRSEVSDEVLKIVDGMSVGEIRKFASTKHKGLPKTAS